MEPRDLVAVAAALAAMPEELKRAVGILSALNERVTRIEERLPPRLFTVEEAAEQLGRSVPSIRRDIRAGRLPVVKLGRSVRIDLAKMKSIDADDVARAAAAARSGLKVLP
jgi:excisionase family DNA binding protein